MEKTSDHMILLNLEPSAEPVIPQGLSNTCKYKAFTLLPRKFTFDLQLFCYFPQQKRSKYLKFLILYVNKDAARNITRTCRNILVQGHILHMLKKK